MTRTTFIPTAIAQLYRFKSFSVTGRPELGDPVDIGIAPVRVETELFQTSIRTDKSGSQARAAELVASVRILVDPDVELTHDDVIGIDGSLYRIQSIFPRYEMIGVLNHRQVDLTTWAG